MEFLQNISLVLLVFAVHSQASLIYRSEKTLETTDDVTRAKDDEQVYTFVADGTRSPYAFLDDVGVLTGFDVDIVNAVCKQANKKCFFTLAESTKCSFTDRLHDYAGEGIMSKWFDACSGYAITNDRQVNFDFTLPFKKSASFFSVLPGNPTKFDPESTDFSKFVIVKLNGTVTNAPCFTRLDKKFDKLLDANTVEEAIQMVKSGKADIFMSSSHHVEGLDTLKKDFRCSQWGSAMMVRKGSEIPDWWNDAFRHLYFSLRYEKICKRAVEKYGVKPNCLGSPEELEEDMLAMLKSPVEKPKSDERLWKFVASGRIAPASFINKEGNLQGFTKDLIDRVCRIAGKRCVLMTAEVSECTILDGSYVYPGRGISMDWFDGCPGYFNSVERQSSWDFTAPYLVSAATFRVKPGNPSKFNPKDYELQKWTIVYLSTAIANKHCFHKLHKKFGKVYEVAGVQDAVDMVMNGTADAWFSKYHHPTPLETLPEEFQCQNEATSILLKKGSEVPAWWNPAFEEFYQTGAFNKFCEEKGKEYPGHHFPCLPPPKAKLQKPEVLEGF